MTSSSMDELGPITLGFSYPVYMDAINVWWKN